MEGLGQGQLSERAAGCDSRCAAAGGQATCWSRCCAGVAPLAAFSMRLSVCTDTTACADCRCTAGPLPAQLLPQVLPGAGPAGCPAACRRVAACRCAAACLCLDHPPTVAHPAAAACSEPACTHKLPADQDLVNKAKKKACPSCRHEFGAKVPLLLNWADHTAVPSRSRRRRWPCCSRFSCCNVFAFRCLIYLLLTLVECLLPTAFASAAVCRQPAYQHRSDRGHPRLQGRRAAALLQALCAVRAMGMKAQRAGPADLHPAAASWASGALLMSL